MTIPAWLALTVAGLALTLYASRRAVHHASVLAHGAAIPPFVIGFAFVAIGTDLPEISNSIMASVAGHGDVNVGVSIGSVVAQITLVFGLLALLSPRPLEVDRRHVLPVGLGVIVLLGLGALLLLDGRLARTDGLVLMVSAVLLIALSWRVAPGVDGVSASAPRGRKVAHALLTMFFLGLVGGGAAATVKGTVELSLRMGVSEYLIAFFGSSLGTSLPEVVVSITAARQGKFDLAIGDILGACLVDASLSFGLGPLIRPTSVSGAMVHRGSLTAIAAMALVMAVVVWRRKHDRLSGAFCLLLYGLVYAVILAF